jgi:hypothetical protein
MFALALGLQVAAIAMPALREVLGLSPLPRSAGPLIGAALLLQLTCAVAFQLAARRAHARASR